MTDAGMPLKCAPLALNAGRLYVKDAASAQSVEPSPAIASVRASLNWPTRHKTRRKSMELEDIVRMSQKELKHKATKVLRQRGYMVISEKGFVYAKGEVPVLLVAHLDTVHQSRVRSIFYSKDGSLVMSPEGIGGDDRAGIYAILQIVKKHRCHVLFCEDEEIGCQGARRFADSGIIPDVHYIVELDRRGDNDAVFYNCDNPEFTEFVCGFGFQQETGSFSDICVIAPVIGTAAVNISAGYYNEHTRSEYINLDVLQHNIERVEQMILSPTSRKFKYMERSFHSRYGYGMFSFWDIVDGEYEADPRKRLMYLPESAYLSINGHLVERATSHMIDEKGRVYDYVDDIDAAIRAENATAYTRAGLPLKYERKQAKLVQVIPFEEAIELLGDMEVTYQ
jgi:putative aminopeptidase FrvX